MATGKLTFALTDRILARLIEMPMLSVRIVNPADEQTIEAIKYVMDTKQDKSNGFEITFNDKFSKIKKTNGLFWTGKSNLKFETKKK